MQRDCIPTRNRIDNTNHVSINVSYIILQYILEIFLKKIDPFPVPIIINQQVIPNCGYDTECKIDVESEC